MRFYDQQHKFYCGVDLHTRRMYLCILDREGNKVLHRNMRAKPRDFLLSIERFRDDLVVGAKCMFTWYYRVRARSLSESSEPTPSAHRSAQTQCTNARRANVLRKANESSSSLTPHRDILSTRSRHRCDFGRFVSARGCINLGSYGSPRTRRDPQI